MAGIFLEVDNDIKKLRGLRDEIERTKKSLESIKVTVDIDISKDLEARLKSLTDEYDALARKITENEGRIMLSVKRINDAARRIADMQETVSKPSYSRTQDGGTALADKAVTDSVAQQAKAYDNLREKIDEVMGSRNESVVGMLREQDAMRKTNAQIETIRKKQTGGYSLTDGEQERLKALTASLQEHKIALADFRQRLNNAFRIEHAVPTSMDALSQSLGRMRSTYRALAEDERNSTFGKELLESIQQADAKIKELDAAIGNHQRNVGNYPSPRAELRELTQQVVQLATAYRALSDEERSGAKGQELRQKLKDTTQKAAALKDTISDMQATISQDANDQAAFQGIAQGLNLLVSGFATAKGAAAELGLSEEELVEVQTTLQTALAANNLLTEASNALQKQSALMRSVAAIQTAAAAKAEDIKTAATGRGVIATKAATVAQAAFNTVAKANPYLVLAAALVTVVGAVWGLAKAYKANKDEAEKSQKAMEAIRKESQHQKEMMTDSVTGTLTQYKKLQTEWNRLRTSQEKNGWIKSNQTAFKNLGLSISSVSDAERAMVSDSGSVIAALRAKAEAAAAMNLYMEAYERKLRKDLNGSVANGRYYKRVKEGDVSGQKAHVMNTSAGPVITYTYEHYTKETAHAENERRRKEALKLQQKETDQLSRYSEAAEKAAKKAEAAAKATSGLVTLQKTDNKGNGVDDKPKYAELMHKQAIEREKAERDMLMRTEQSYIDLMEDGTRKAVAQIEHDYEAQVNAINDEYDSLREQKIRKQKELFEANPANKGKTFAVNESAVAYTHDENEDYFKRLEVAQKMRDDALKAIREKETESMRGYLKEYGTYLERKAAITEEYDEKIRKAQTEGDKKILEAQRTEALDALDEKFGKSAKAMADLFEDASDKSVKSIQAIIDKYELLVKYMSGGSDISVDDLKKVGFTDKDLRNIENGTTSLKDLTDALKNLKGVLAGKSPWLSFTSDMTKAIEKIKGAKGDISKIGEGITGLGNSVESFAPSLKQFSSDISNIFGADDSKIQKAIDGVEGLGNTAAGIGQAMSGDIVGGVMNAVHGVSQMVSALDGMFGADYSQYDRMVEQYDRLNQVWDELIDKKREYISESYGAEAVKVGKEAEEIARKSIESYRALGRELLNSGASAGSHSIGMRQRNGMSSEGWSELQSAAREIGFDYSSVADGRMTGLFDLTKEQLERLKEEAPTFWAKLNGDVQDYLDKIIDGAERLEDIQERTRQQLTQTSFDEVFDNFLDNLMDLEYKAADAGKDVSESFMKAMLRNMVGSKYKKQLEDWYLSFSADMEDNQFLDNREELLNSYTKIFEQAARERDQLAELIGYEGNTSSSSQQGGTHKTFEGASQDQMDEANGRMTALQVNTERMLELGEEQSRSLSALGDRLDTIASAGNEIRDISDEIMDIMAQSYLELVGIRENTGAIVKPIRNMSERMDSWNSKIMGL